MDLYLIALIMFVGALLQGITGFGSGLIAIPLLSLLLPLTTLTPVVSIINLILAGYLGWLLRHYLAPQQWRAMLSAGVVGTLLGNWVLMHFNLTWLQLGMALFVFSTGVLLLAGQRAQLQPTNKVQSSVGLVAGFCNGALTLGGPPVVLFLANHELERLKFRATLTLFFFILALTNVVSFSWQGQYQPSHLPMIGALLVGALAGAFLGHKISALLPEKLFRRLTLALVLIAALVAFLSGLPV